MEIFSHSSEKVMLRYIGVNQDAIDKAMTRFEIESLLFSFKSRGTVTVFENPHAKSIQKFIKFLDNSVTKENPKTCVRIGMYKIMHKSVEQKRKFLCQRMGPPFLVIDNETSC